MPDGRTTDYAIWRACERFKIKPPGTKENWDDINVWTQAMLIAYDQVRSIEDIKEEVDRFNALIKVFSRAFGH